MALKSEGFTVFIRYSLFLARKIISTINRIAQQLLALLVFNKNTKKIQQHLLRNIEIATSADSGGRNFLTLSLLYAILLIVLNIGSSDCSSVNNIHCWYCTYYQNTFLSILII